MIDNYGQMIKDLSEFNVALSERQLQQFDEYYNLLIKWNEVMNLTAITDFEDVCRLHFVDSISGSEYFDFTKKGLSLADIGTGAGFPGIPLKIVYPHLNVTLIDSLNKRVNFLIEVIECLGLNEIGSITTLHGRAEDYCQGKNKNLRESFDVVVSRAVANMSTLSEYCLPYVKTGGVLMAYKGDKGKEELSQAQKAIDILGGKLKSVNQFLLPNSDINRTICIIEKVVKTPGKYPRKAGMPSKEPLT